MDVVRPEQFSKANTDQLGDKDLLREQFSSFAGAYGLALQGLDLTKVTANLLPTEIAKQAVWRRKKPAFAAAAACLALAGGLVWFRQITDMSALAAGNDAPPSIESVEDATRIIDNGPSPSLSARAQTRAIIDAGAELKKELSRLSGQGDTERADTEQFISLQRNKGVVEHIFDVVHATVPRSKAFGNATTPEEIRQALARGATPRAKRVEVTVEGIDSHFEPNLNLFDFKSLVAAPPPLSDYDPQSSSELPGFLLKIKCRSGNEGTIEFIAKQFMDPLRKAGRKPETGFYFDQVILASGERIGSSRARGRGRGMGGMQPGQADTGPLPEDLDPVTHESMVDDWRYEVWVSVILEDYPGGDEDAEEGAENG